MKAILFQLYKQQSLKLCLGNLKLFLQRLSLSLLDSLLPPFSSVRQVTLGGLNACVGEIANNYRHVLGIMCVLVGAGGIFAHQLFFDESVRDFNWYYVNHYYFIYTIRPYIVLIFWSAGFILLTPTKYTLAFIPFSLAHSIGWLGLIHYSLFVTSNESFHSVPHWHAFVVAISMGFGVIMTLDSLLYSYNHITLNNHSSFVGITEMKGLKPEEKEPMYQTLAKNFRNKHQRI